MPTVGIAVVESAHRGVIDEPGKGFGGPVECIPVDLLNAGDIGHDHAVVYGRVALAKVVHLGMSGVVTNKLPVNFVEIVGLQNDGRDDTSAASSLHGNLNKTVVEVTIALNGGRITSLLDTENNTLLGELGTLCSLLPALKGLLAVLEVALEVLGDGRVVVALLLHGVAKRPCLRISQRRQGARREDVITHYACELCGSCVVLRKGVYE